MRPAPLLVAICSVLASSAGLAGEAAKASLTLERHHTSNALDAPLALADWYSVLRGALEDTVEHELGTTRLLAEFEATAFDTYAFEDDNALALSAETTVKPAEHIEIRGAISWRRASEGDDLPVAGLIIGTETTTDVLAAALQLGAQLDPRTILVFETSAAREVAGDTNFYQDVLPAVELEPDRTRLRAATTLTRKHGLFSYGAIGAASFLRVDPVGLTPGISLADFTLKTQGEAKFANGAVVGAALGLQSLHGADGLVADTRPVWEVAASTPLPHGFSLRGSIRAAFDTVDTDDPLVSWVRRAEIEAGYQFSPKLEFGIGFFDERRENLLLENREKERGAYGLVAWHPSDRLTLLFRVDITRHRTTVVDIEKNAVDAHLALTAKL